MDKDERITGGNKRKIQKRRAPRQSFTAAKRQVFLDNLASCANVTRAAAAAGVGVSTVYDARRREPAFAEQWADAIEAGYATLEALLIERAALGAAYVPGGDIGAGAGDGGDLAGARSAAAEPDGEGAAQIGRGAVAAGFGEAGGGVDLCEA